MNPKINGILGGPTRVEGGERPSDIRTGINTGPGPTAPPDQVSLTDSARLMVRLEKIVADVPAIDRDRVETIKQAIADGTYAVDARKVAAEVLRMELELNKR